MFFKTKNNKKLKLIQITKCLVFVVFLLFAFGAYSSVFAQEKQLLISEIMYDPIDSDSGKEWIEVFNNSQQSIILEDWILFEEETNHKITSTSTEKEIAPNQHAIITTNPKSFLENYSEYSQPIFKSSFSLKNSGEKIALKNLSKEIIDEIEYTSSWGGNGNGKTLELCQGNWQESSIISGSPGAENCQKKTYSDKITINEILPNPAEDEIANEYIELKNNSSKDIDLSYWTLRDASKSGIYVFPQKTIVTSGDFLTIYRADFKFALNNDKETLRLLNPNGGEVFSINYADAQENISYGFDGSSWRWSKFLTPNQINVFGQSSKIETDIDKNIYTNIYANFSVDIKNSENENSKVVWDFGDGHKSYKAKTRHKYIISGNYLVTLTVFDGVEKTKETISVQVKDYPKTKIFISAVSPNPNGRDSKNEYIIIKNNSKKKINLKGWSIATGWEKLINHPIRTKIKIDSGKEIKITHKDSAFSLNNKKAKIELRYPDGKVADKIKYKRKESIADDEIFDAKTNTWISQNDETSIAAEEILEESHTDIEPIESDIDLPIEVSPDILGKQSQENKNYKVTLLASSDPIVKHNLYANNFNRVLGSTTSSFDQAHHFSYSQAEKDHYLVVFFKNIFWKMNSKINQIITKK